MYNRQFHIAPGACVVYTMTATVIVPGRETPCSQWISFNGDNEPVLNTSPDVDDSCDTFLRRLQRSKLIRQNDPNLPSGQQFCFEAMVDKRYNRWKRRRRKKQSEAIRICITQSSESSDENDESFRNTAMERIIDKMYEEIHGPVPHTPNGSRDTPRLRNRRRREEDISVKTTPTYADSEEPNPLAVHYDVLSDGNSDGYHLSSSSACQMRTEPTEAPAYEPEQELPEQSCRGNISDDLCSWPYLEQYKEEIHLRLRSTSDQMEELDQNDWLPETSNHDNEDADDRDECGNISEQSRDTDTATPDEYEPYTRVVETPRQSSAPVSPVFNEPCNINDRPRPHQEINSSNQTYSYAKWSRSQRSLATKVTSADQSPKHLSRTSTTSLSDIGYDPVTQNCINVASWREKDMDQASFRPIKSQDLAQVPIKRQELVQRPIKRQELVQRPIKRQEFVQAPRDRLAKKNMKVALDIKKQNVNLPSLTKCPRLQTLPDTSRMNSTERPDRTLTNITKARPKPPTICEETPKTKLSTDEIQPRSTTRESQTVPEFIFRDYYLRNMYGSKIRINSHSDCYKNDKTLRKALTVDDLDIRTKKTKKKSDASKTDHLNFTRSFTFSMFDLPEMHKLYNSALDRRANGEDVEGYE